jgi:hypothetical protein
VQTFDGAGGYRVHYGFDVPSLPGSILHNGILPPFQGFWVRTAQVDGTPGVITFKPSHAATSSGTLYKQKSQKSEYLLATVEGVTSSTAASAILWTSSKDSTQIKQVAPASLNGDYIHFGWADPSSKNVFTTDYVNSSVENELKSLLFSASKSGEFKMVLQCSSTNNSYLIELLDANAQVLAATKTPNETLTYSFTYTAQVKKNQTNPLLPSQHVSSTDENKITFTLRLTPIPLKNEHEQEIPKVFKLYQNYPNPFNPSTTIRFDLPENGLVQLEVFDVLGKSIQLITNKEFTAGTHELRFDASKLSSGLYFYRITVNNSFTQTRSFTLLK